MPVSRPAMMAAASAQLAPPAPLPGLARPDGLPFPDHRQHRQQYLRALDAATGRGGVAVFGCFAPDGPQHCSGLPVARYSPAQLARQLGARWLMVSQDREEHITPAGATQPFTWIALRRQS